ncbi:mannitol dehydrogenase family protein [Virgisporangium ochraceum]|uniref:Mannitol-1-phosphate 5-dehydrogenase n=1 Tax=Virgisporangium ochraceum TaxID=65505 RepID=A0A8J3ZN75_9ACTN|nr:mannitol dehydrogenase family protein [Virgisporangium ochraceum]GIJ67384.1 mannitol dehydrogenase [Virgisporangium ochraceum]
MAVDAAVARLGRSTVDLLPDAARPLLDGGVGAGILHLGLGAFHRAHQAVYIEDAIVAAGGDWGIVGVAPRSVDILNALAAQDRLYSVLTVGPGSVRPRTLGVHVDLMHAAADPLAVVARLADPAIRMVTLTVTEKAYRLDPVSGVPRIDDEVRADVVTDRPPRTVPGLLARGLLARAATGAPIAVVSCDNLPSNGRRTRALLEAALAEVPGPAGERARAWLDGAVSFPGTMVDRIVPATTDATRASALRALGVADLVPVAAEPFAQWVVEDEFPGGRPAWEHAGVVLTDDARPWESLKLRTLNGVHSALAYLGALAGVGPIDEVLHLPGIDAFLDRLIGSDIAPTLVPPPGVSVEAYGRTVRERFANPALGYRTLQVAMDGSQKLPQRLIGTLVDRRAAGARPVWGCLVLAAWMRFVRGYADDGTALPLDDPLADRLRGAVSSVDDKPSELAAALFAIDAVFPAELAGDDEVRGLVEHWLTVLARGGVPAVLAEVSSS